MLPFVHHDFRLRPTVDRHSHRLSRIPEMRFPEEQIFEREFPFLMSIQLDNPIELIEVAVGPFYLQVALK